MKSLSFPLFIGIGLIALISCQESKDIKLESNILSTNQLTKIDSGDVIQADFGAYPAIGFFDFHDS